MSNINAAVLIARKFAKKAGNRRQLGVIVREFKKRASMPASGQELPFMKNRC
ncbi:hypothetical protein [Parendozoicomonas haliclonae]|uniref:hypothetical protein n=1 Tax=Parendozoicomonas haliclonae TaxID=1960125 RepID=UPI0013FD99A1|nr:hypothetical protein [Parendozoicomonas haliclonae]